MPKIRIYANGYPTKASIRNLIEAYGVDASLITFSEGYREGRRVGILWRRSDIKAQMIGIDKHFQEQRIPIRKLKEWGEVHSLWFDQIDIADKYYICIDD